MPTQESGQNSAHDSGSVRSKLITMAVSTTFVALLAAAIAMLLYDLRNFQQTWVDDLTTQADIIAAVTAPALAFNDVKAAGQNLSVLRVRPQIVAGPARGWSGANWWWCATSSTTANCWAPCICARATTWWAACSATRPFSAW